MKQHFKVGEVAIICSNSHSIFNGQLTRIIYVENDINAIDENLNPLDGKIAYMTTNGRGWMQSALRKYYPPSTKTFTEIMQGLKKPVKA